MIEIKLSKDEEAVAVEDPFNLKFTPLKHQLETYRALQDNQLVMNLHNTGTGKTLAALLYFFDITDNVLFIAPTNELINQHAGDIREFVSENDLEFNVIQLDAAILSSLTSQAKRKGDKLHRLLKNPLQFVDELNLEFRDKKAPFVFVTNPDIFYYALYFQYGKIDQRNLCQDFAALFSYIVIDEFHYYSAKQFANFLFFFALSKEFGYFKEGRKICLLSATPAQYVIDYLDCLELKQKIIDLDSEAGAEKLQTLTQAAVEIRPGNIEDNLEFVEEEINKERSRGRDGVVISNSLARINWLHWKLARDDCERITGPQGRSERRKAGQKGVILATPTVDIGYNFSKEGKDRQNVDFGIVEAASNDELLQRIGRIGRVLGKKIKDQASKIMIFVNEDSYYKLKEELKEGKEYRRREFADLLVELDAPPQKKEFVNYISSYALLESFYPLYKMYYVMPDHIKGYIEELFTSLQQVFGGNKTFRQLLGKVGNFQHQKQVAEGRKELSQQDYKDFYFWFQNEKCSKKQLKQVIDDPGVKKSVQQFVKQEYAVKQALFNFRDSFSEPTAAVYDPGRILSGEEVTTYSLLHIIRNYRYNLYSEEKFKSVVGNSAEADFYLQLDEFRDKKLNLSYRLRAPYSDLFSHCNTYEQRDFFEEKMCGRPTAVTGLRLTVDKPVEGEILNYFKEQYVPLMLISEGVASSLFKAIKHSSIYPEKVEVLFPDGKMKKYWTVLGTSAFLVYPEIKGAVYAHKRSKEQEIII